MQKAIPFDPHTFDNKKLLPLSECTGLVKDLSDEITISPQGLGVSFLDEETGQKSELTAYLTTNGQYVYIEALRETNDDSIAGFSSLMLNTEKAKMLQDLLNTLLGPRP
jgi:hypothetical protein